MKPNQSARIWADVAFFTRGESTRTLAPNLVATSPGFTFLSPIFGFGVFLGSNAELEAILPVGTTIADNGGTGIGNPYAGVSYVMDGPKVRLKVGGGIAFPLVDSENRDQLAGVSAGLAPRAFQTAWLWAPDSVGLVVPFHIEAPLGTPVLFIGDATPFVLVPVRNNNETNMYMELSPGFGGYVSDDVVLGLRVPMFFRLTNGGGDEDQVSLEPFIRYASDPFFFSVRFTMPIDEPLGFAFDTGKFWGLHLGLGGGF
jgi:hypothetical protein